MIGPVKFNHVIMSALKVPYFNFSSLLYLHYDYLHQHDKMFSTNVEFNEHCSVIFIEMRYEYAMYILNKDINTRMFDF